MELASSTAAAVITSAITDYGTEALVILTAVIGLGVGYLIFRFGWRKTKGALR